MLNGDIKEYKRFQKKLDRCMEVTDDLSTPFRLMARDFYKDQKQVFSLKGTGQYKPLSPKYAKQKDRDYKKGKSNYPSPNILKYSGRVMGSLTNSNHPDAILDISPHLFRIGSDVDYLVPHQSPDEPRTLPYRPAIINSKVKGGHVDKWKEQEKRWTSMVMNYTVKELKSKLEGRY